ncbi:MAG: hypothetical protein V2J62_13270 [candidate division KSB1 bacterium]|jgi:hypothetical protein|nr:hypothetical protein [candidate division KSB1 bacterium]
MLEKHPGDREIQEYVSGLLSEGMRKRIDSHLQACDMCRETVSGYATIFNALKQDTVPDLDADFSMRVLKKLGNKPAHGRLNIFRDVLLYLTGIVLSIGSVLYFVDVGKYSKFFHQFDFQFLISAGKNIGAYLGKANIDPPLILMSLAALLLIMGLDHLLHKHRDKLSDYLNLTHTI